MVECNLMLKNSLLSENCCERGNNLLEELWGIQGTTDL